MLTLDWRFWYHTDDFLCPKKRYATTVLHIASEVRIGPPAGFPVRRLFGRGKVERGGEGLRDDLLGLYLVGDVSLSCVRFAAGCCIKHDRTYFFVDSTLQVTSASVVS